MRQLRQTASESMSGSAGSSANEWRATPEYDMSDRAREESRELERMARMRPHLAPALVLLSLLSLALLPALIEGRTQTLWREISSLAEPARSDISELQAALALEAAGTRGFLLTGNGRFGASVARARTRQNSAEARLRPLASRLGPGIAAQVATLTDTLHAAHLLLDSLYSGHLSRREYLARFGEQQSRYDAVMSATARLNDEIGLMSAARRDEIMAADRAGATLTLVLVLFALGATALVAYLAQEYRSLAHRLDERVRQLTALGRIARALGAAERASDVVQTVADSVVQTTRAIGAYVERLRTPGTPSDAEVVAAAGESVPAVGASIPEHDAPSAALARSGEIQIQRHADAATLTAHLEATWHRCSSLAVPLTDRGRVIGALVLLCEPADVRFTPTEVEYVHALGDLASSPLRKFALLDALAESEQRFRQIAENMHDLVWLGDPLVPAPLYVNAAYERIWGRTRESLLDDPESWIRAIHPDDRARVMSAASRAARRGEFHAEYRVVRPDGEIRWVRSRGFPVRNPRGEAYRMVGITEDITERKLAELERERLLRSEQAARAITERRSRELRRVTDSRTRLIRGFTHDVRNPLGAADGFLSLLESGMQGELSPEQQESVHRVRRSIQAALGLIAHLLELARAEAGQLEIRREPVDVRDIAREVTEEYRAQARAGELDLAIDLPDEFRKIECDPARARQILANLVSNAVKYTPPGGRVTVRVRIRSRVGLPGPAEWVAVDVTDTGPGIPASEQALVFEEFTRFDPGAVHGTGIGLAISQRVARALGGDLTVESTPGLGSTFTLWLPVRVAVNGR